MTDMTPLDLAKVFVRHRPNALTLDTGALEDAVREYVNRSYSQAFSSVRAAQALGMKVSPDDEKTVQLLQPYIGNVQSVVNEVLNMADNTASSPYSAVTPVAHQPDPSQMTMNEYAEYRKTHQLSPDRGMFA